MKKDVDTIFESQPADAEEKEERESLPPEFDEDTQNRYFERKDKGNASRMNFGIKEQPRWVDSQKEHHHSQVTSGEAAGRYSSCLRSRTTEM